MSSDEKIVNVARQVVEGWAELQEQLQQRQTTSTSLKSPGDSNVQEFNGLISLLDQLTAQAIESSRPAESMVSKDTTPQLRKFLEEEDEWQTLVERDPKYSVPLSKADAEVEPLVGNCSAVVERPASPSASSFSLVADSALSTAVSDDTVILDIYHGIRQDLDKVTQRDLNEKLCRIVTSGQATKNIIARATDLIDAGADVNARDEWCDGTVYDKLWKDCRDRKGRLPATVLYGAVASRADCDVIRLLLNRGADINRNGGFSGTPLQAIVITDEKDLVRLLLNRGAEMNAPLAGYGRSTFLLAARYGTVGIVELLLERGAQITQADSQKVTALHDAAFRGHVGMIKLLLDRGAFIDAKKRDTGATPLGEALRMASSDGVKVLLARGADVKFLPRVQETYADSVTRQTMIDMLKEYGAEYACPSSDVPPERKGRVPIYELVRQEHVTAKVQETTAEQRPKDVVTKEEKSPEDDQPLAGCQKEDDEAQSVSSSGAWQIEETGSVRSFQTTSTAKTKTSWRRKLWSRFSSDTTLHDNV